MICPICSKTTPQIPSKKANTICSDERHTLAFFVDGYTLKLFNQSFAISSRLYDPVTNCELIIHSYLFADSSLNKTDFHSPQMPLARPIYSHPDFIPLDKLNKYIQSIYNIKAFL